MPSGVYERHPHKRITKADLMKYIEFTFRDDVQEAMLQARYPYKIAVKMYYDETGIKINEQTAYRQRHRWIKINDRIYELTNH